MFDNKQWDYIILEKYIYDTEVGALPTVHVGLEVSNLRDTSGGEVFLGILGVFVEN